MNNILTSSEEREPVDVLIEAAWVVPIEPSGAVLENHAVAITGDTIVGVLPTIEARGRFIARERIELASHALLPGLVNAHVHNPMTLMRGLADDLRLSDWLENHIWPAERRAVGPQFVRDGVELAIAEMMRGGTTLCSENYYFPDVIASTYQRLGFRAMVGLPVLEFPSAWAGSADEYLDKAIAVHEAFQGSRLISTCIAPHAPYTVSDQTFERVRELSERRKMLVHLHLHETGDEIQNSLTQYGARPLQRIQSLGLLTTSLIAVHMTQLTDDEIRACAGAQVTVVHCPESNLKLASGFCPVGRLLASGVRVALGTDGCASNNDLDMIGEMRTAALLAKGVASDPRVLDAVTALRMATLEGARALGMGDRVGSIVPGKQADLIAVRLDEIDAVPIYDVTSYLVYAANRRQVSDVWIAGLRKLASGQLVGFDLVELRERATHWQNFLKSSTKLAPR